MASKRREKSAGCICNRREKMKLLVLRMMFVMLACGTLFICIMVSLSIKNKNSSAPGLELTPMKRSGFSLQPEPTKRNGKFVGSNGQHLFYKAKARDWFVEPEIIKRYCRATNLTQCSPVFRTEQQKQADRASRGRPVRVTIYRPFTPDPTEPNFSECNYNNCVYAGHEVTPESDAIFIYGIKLNEDAKVPAVRLPHQVFIFSGYEPVGSGYSTALSNSNSKWRTFFNATMTYRLNSDVFKPYGVLDFQPKAEKDLPDYRAIARRKTRTAIWIVSNCRTQSMRMQYVKEMQKYMTIDIFGKCGEKCEVVDERCVADFNSTYRFYLAFESSFNTDYITEKFFKLFIDDTHIVPVVRGSLDYKRELPEKSLINAADFKSPKDLALFLKSLEVDEVEYSKYLEVKDRYRAIDTDRWCGLCEYMHKLWTSPHVFTHGRQVDLQKELLHGHVLSPSVIG
ncbi:hypothetical protein EGW08_004211 [Elysia chlorotica]|uniref:Fucosyltransferase n=1 Tax=Elysia chlorotica TaxID=188477 RepID=A0A433U2L0_ELYCH|nr:hypothetical protein EGW08_004211 [Elysia chlorotica]